VYPVDVKLIWPITKVRGKPRKHHVPDILSIAAEQMLASAKWRTVSWRSGTNAVRQAGAGADANHGVVSRRSVIAAISVFARLGSTA
jgi:hypothetical protein